MASTLKERKKLHDDANIKLANDPTFTVVFQTEYYSGIYLPNYSVLFNQFSTNFPFTDKPGSWLFLAKCLKNTRVRVAFSVKMQVSTRRPYFTRRCPTLD